MDEGYAKEELWGVCTLRAYEQLFAQEWDEVRCLTLISPTHPPVLLRGAVGQLWLGCRFVLRQTTRIADRTLLSSLQGAAIDPGCCAAMARAATEAVYATSHLAILPVLCTLLLPPFHSDNEHQYGRKSPSRPATGHTHDSSSHRLNAPSPYLHSVIPLPSLLPLRGIFSCIDFTRRLRMVLLPLCKRASMWGLAQPGTKLSPLLLVP